MLKDKPINSQIEELKRIEKIIELEIIPKLSKKYYDKNEGWEYIPEAIRECGVKGFQKGKQEAQSQFLEMLDEMIFNVGKYWDVELHQKNAIDELEELKSQLTKGDEK